LKAKSVFYNVDMPFFCSYSFKIILGEFKTALHKNKKISLKTAHCPWPLDLSWFFLQRKIFWPQTAAPGQFQGYLQMQPGLPGLPV